MASFGGSDFRRQHQMRKCHMILYFCLNYTNPTSSGHRKPTWEFYQIVAIACITSRNLSLGPPPGLNIPPWPLKRPQKSLSQNLTALPPDPPACRPSWLPVSQTKRKNPYGRFSFVQWPEMGRPKHQHSILRIGATAS